MAKRVFVRRDGTQSGGTGAIILEAGANLLTGEGKFKTAFGGMTSLEADLLLLASAIFAADRCIVRGEREDFGTREIEISVPLVNIGRFQPVKATLEELLRTLSNDSWRVTFRQVSGNLDEAPVGPAAEGHTLLFSGGLDSLAAAIELGTQPLQLVSHTTRNQRTSVAQDELVSQLGTLGIIPTHRKFLVSASSRMPAPNISFEAESSQRTRSFLFLALGFLCARRVGHTQVVYLAENGQLAVHLPLTHARIGAFSTHTAHPDVLAKAQIFFNGVCQTSLSIVNPYVHKTKAEVTKIVWDRLRSAVPVTISCWKNSRLGGGATHCGICVPCIIRRIAIESHGPDPTVYERDLFADQFASLDQADDGRRNLADLGEFTMRVESYSQQEITEEWPELYSSTMNRTEIIGMYKRACIETRTILTRYQNLAAVLT